MTKEQLLDKYTVKIIDWDNLCKDEILSEDFIREFSEYVN